jgi:hypothetical protein
MLVLHLSSLASISFLPGEQDGVSIKKVCLRKESKAKMVVSAAMATGREDLFTQGDGATDSKPEIKHCSVKLFCTAATDVLTFSAPAFKYLEPTFAPSAYHLLITPSDPDPPRRS